MVTSNGKLQDANGRVANIVTTDIKASNGVVHVIDRVILPKDKIIIDKVISHKLLSLSIVIFSYGSQQFIGLMA